MIDSRAVKNLHFRLKSYRLSFNRNYTFTIEIKNYHFNSTRPVSKKMLSRNFITRMSLLSFTYWNIFPSLNPCRLVFLLFNPPVMYQILALLNRDLILKKTSIMIQKDTIPKRWENEWHESLWNRKKHVSNGRNSSWWRNSDRSSLSTVYPSLERLWSGIFPFFFFFQLF